MKLWIQLPSRLATDKVHLRRYLDIVEKAKRPETEVLFRPLAAGPGLTSPGGFGYYGLRFLNEREVLRNAYRAQQEGCDGVVIDCYFDPAVRAARQILSLPVVGIAEASMLLASLMCLRFAVVTSDRRYVEGMVETLHLYGMARRAIEVHPVRAIGLEEGEFLGCVGGPSGPLVENFIQVAEGCLRDGAEVIIAGCGLMARALTEAGLRQVQEAPVIDPLIAGIKVAEMMVDLHQAGFPVVSRFGLFRGAPSETQQEASRLGLL